MDEPELGRIPDSLWKRIREEPQRAPEHIAVAAAARFGPQSQRWVSIAGPGHTPEQLARVAMKKHVRLSRLEGAALGVGGFTTAAADLTALAWIQSRMVFYIGAAYGYDPTHPMRPAELLALTGFYETPAEARHALDGLGKPLAQATVERTLAKRELTLVERLLRYAGERAARHVGGRLIPFVGAPIGAVQNAGATKELGRNAIAYYGGPPQARP